MSGGPPPTGYFVLPEADMEGALTPDAELSADDVAEQMADVDDVDVDVDVDDEDDIDQDSPETDRMEPFDTTGLREIGNLASWTVSTAKPGCGVQALRDDDANLYWQSDGPQPHILNIHFIKMVNITNIRVYLDFTLDESYTPTRLIFLAGTSSHDLIDFAELSFEQPKGWIDVDLTGVGGGRDGNVLRAFIVQMKVMENHQNGKDTHVRGVKIYAKDESVRATTGSRKAAPWGETGAKPPPAEEEADGLDEPDWLANPVLR
ncbi:MAG: anaphase promoting complex subunit doc1 [Lichina confinis]|nr:MAG: anaphase promoting complex subunit doc1 [Lichina confinis]